MSNKKRISGEYDPPIPVEKNPTKEQIEAAEKLKQKYEQMAKQKNK